MNQKNDFFYVMISSTPNRIGGFIRTVTHSPFNHTSVSLDKDLSVLYSFARRYFDAPFSGSFIMESHERFTLGGRRMRVKVFALPASREALTKIAALFEKMKNNPDRYPYNLFSAAFVPLKKRVLLHGSFTCSEFASDLIAEYLPEYGFRKGEFLLIDDVVRKLAPYEIYDGVIPSTAGKGFTENYLEHHSIYRRARMTASSVAALVAAKKLQGKETQRKS